MPAAAGLTFSCGFIMDKQTVLKVARLARLEIDEARADDLAHGLSGLFKWIDQLQEVNTDGIEPMTGVGQQQAFLREDAVTDGNRQSDVLANAPEAIDGFFVVPKVVE